MVVEGVVDTFQHVADHIRLLRCVSPDKQLEVDAGIAHLGDDTLHRLLGVYPLVMQVVDGRLYKHGYLLEVRAISHTKGNDGQDIAVIASEVLIVLRKQLGILAGDDLAL